MEIPFVEMMVSVEGSPEHTSEHVQLYAALDFINGYMTRCVYFEELEPRRIMENLVLEKVSGRLRLEVFWSCNKSRKKYEHGLKEVMAILGIEDYYYEVCEAQTIPSPVLEKRVDLGSYAAGDLPPWFVDVSPPAHIGGRPVLVSVDKLPQWARDNMAAQQQHMPRSTSDQ